MEQTQPVAAQESRSIILMSVPPPGRVIFTIPSSLSIPISCPERPLLSPRRMMTLSRLDGRTTSSCAPVARTVRTSSTRLTSYSPSGRTSAMTPRFPSAPGTDNVTRTRSGRSSAAPPLAPPPPPPPLNEPKPEASAADEPAAHDELPEMDPEPEPKRLDAPPANGDSPSPAPPPRPLMKDAEEEDKASGAPPPPPPPMAAHCCSNESSAGLVVEVP
mmetsp:Transcript_17112/g.51742  ORF Transcript_17112/g.51742 Transcript_17112/m.51742 type:complete len:217 (+) Transcript_17112:279-929(+)